MSESRLTRAAAREATALIAQQYLTSPAPDALVEKANRGATSKAKRQASSRKSVAVSKKPVNKATKTTTKNKKTTGKGKKTQLKPASKKSQKRTLKPAASKQLPHNLGSIPLSFPLTVSAISPASSDKENQANKDTIHTDVATAVEHTVNDVAKDISQRVAKEESPKKAKAKQNTYGLTPGRSPFPKWHHPTAEECEVLNKLLSEVHGEVIAPETIPAPSLTVAGCGEVPSVLDALIRTLLSAATTGANSSRAFNGLVQRFGILEEGIGKGSVNWEAVRQASLKDVFDAIKSGGLADVKSKNLKAILDMVHQENQERRKLLLSDQSASSAPDNKATDLIDSTNKAEKDKQYEITCAEQNFLSLNHLHNVSSDEAMTELTKYPGIGPKTAACVILFCLQRPCFAVDTHIFRLCKWLGWVPSKGVNEVTAFSHLEVRIPDHLKYSLHQLFIRHGKTCPRCRAITRESSAGWEEGCAIDHLVKRTGKLKGAGRVAGKKSKKGKAKSATTKRKAGTQSAAAPSKKPKVVTAQNEKEGEIEIEIDELSEVSGLSDTVLDGVSD